MKVCPKCKLTYGEEYVFCKKCGTSLMLVDTYNRSRSRKSSVQNNINNTSIFIVILVVVLALSGIAYYYFNQKVQKLESKVNSQSKVFMDPYFDRNHKDNENSLNQVNLNLPLKNNKEDKTADDAINNYLNKIESSSQNSVGVKDSFAFISGQDVRFRKTPNGEVIGSFNRGDKVTILDRTGNWYNIRRSDGVVGYVSADYCKILYKDAPAHITGTDVRFRKYPDGQILGYFDKGEKVIVLNRTGKWYGVIRKNGSVGYVHIDYCKINDEYCPF